MALNHANLEDFLTDGIFVGLPTFPVGFWIDETFIPAEEIYCLRLSSTQAIALTLGQSKAITPTLSAVKVMGSTLKESVLIEQELTMRARYTIALDMGPVCNE